MSVSPSAESDNSGMSVFFRKARKAARYKLTCPTCPGICGLSRAKVAPTKSGQSTIIREYPHNLDLVELGQNRTETDTAGKDGKGYKSRKVGYVRKKHAIARNRRLFPSVS